MISGTITDASGRTLSGQVTEAFWHSVRHVNPLPSASTARSAPTEMRPYLAELARVADTFVSCYPNAGLPNAFGEYDESPEETAAVLEEFAEAGFVNLVGGCCGTGPDAHRGDRRGRARASSRAVRSRSRRRCGFPASSR